MRRRSRRPPRARRAPKGHNTTPASVAQLISCSSATPAFGRAWAGGGDWRAVTAGKTSLIGADVGTGVFSMLVVAIAVGVDVCVLLCDLSLSVGVAAGVSVAGGVAVAVGSATGVDVAVGAAVLEAVGVAVGRS